MKVALKTALVVSILVSSATGFAATAKAKMATPNATTLEAQSSISNQATSQSSMTLGNTYGTRAEPKMHFSTNMLNLLDGKPNVHANFFVMPKVALSVNFMNESEKTSPIKKLVPASTQKFTVSTTQFGVGAAFYMFPMVQKWNIAANPYLLTEKRSDPLDTESNLGIGLKADGLFLVNSLALAAGLQTTSVAGDTNTIVNAGVGYIF